MIKQFKFFAVAAALVGLVDAASAQSNMEVTGKARVRAEMMSEGEGGQTDFISTGVDVNMKWTPDPKVTFFFQPKFVKTFGVAQSLTSTSTSTGGVTTTTTTTQCTSATNASGTCDPLMYVHQAYTTFAHSDKISYMFGRYEMKYGDELVIGPVGWSMIGRSFDGLKAHWTVNDMWWLDLFYNKVTETGTTAAMDHNFNGLYIGGKPVAGMELDLYYLMRDNRTANTDPKTEERNTYGLRLKGAAGAVDYRAEYSAQSGKTAGTNIEKADQMDAEVGFKMDQVYGMRLAAEYFTAGIGYDQLYPTGHKWLGYADLFGRRNITGFRVGISNKWNDHMETALDYHMFSRVDDTVGAYALNGTTSYGTTGTDKNIGSEIDLTVKCTAMKALTWMAGYSMFSAGQYWKDNRGTTNDKVNWAYVMATTNF